MTTGGWHNVGAGTRTRLLQAVVARDGWSCWICGRDPALRPQLDHRLPASRYPMLMLSLGNLSISCARCNNRKNDRVLPGTGVGTISHRWE